MGRFTSVDPARDGLNWNEYANSSPLVWVDPSGLLPQECHGDDVSNVQVVTTATSSSVSFDTPNGSIQVTANAATVSIATVVRTDGATTSGTVTTTSTVRVNDTPAGKDYADSVNKTNDYVVGTLTAVGSAFLPTMTRVKNIVVGLATMLFLPGVPAIAGGDSWEDITTLTWPGMLYTRKHRDWDRFGRLSDSYETSYHLRTR